MEGKLAQFWKGEERLESKNKIIDKSYETEVKITSISNWFPKRERKVT
jgi:hypothetical protein